MEIKTKLFKQIFLPFFIPVILAVICAEMGQFILNGKRGCFAGDVIYFSNCADRTTLFIYDGLRYLIYGFVLLSLILPGILMSRSGSIEKTKIFD